MEQIHNANPTVNNNNAFTKMVDINARKDSIIKMSQVAANTINPIRRLVDQLDLRPNPNKTMIPLSIGDPTIYGNLKCDDFVTEAIVDAVRSGKYNGYPPATGYEESRKAVAKYSSCTNYNLKSDDIIITSGCSSALEHCILALANPGQNILIPRPGFCLYVTLCEAYGISYKYYNLDPDNQWEIDLEDLEHQIDNDTVAILVNNPSNPCGSVYSRQHLIDILAISEKYGLPIIADEIYSFFVFGSVGFEFMAALNDRVPVLSCSGLTKRFMCPGWRLGWIAIYDNSNRLKEIRQGLADLATRTNGANSVVQGALKEILTGVSEEYFKSTIKVIKENFNIVTSILSKAPGIKVVKPEGAMYVMIQVQLKHFKAFTKNDDFIINMVNEESVFCLPSEVFGIQNYFRILLTLPRETMSEACWRIKSYCCRHFSA